MNEEEIKKIKESTKKFQELQELTIEIVKLEDKLNDIKERIQKLSYELNPEILEVWNHKVMKKEEGTRTDLNLKLMLYKTTDGQEGILVPLDNNNTIIQAFVKYIDTDTIKDKLSRREDKYHLIQYSTFNEEDKELQKVFQDIGFYVLGKNIVFHAEPDYPNSPTPMERLEKWVEYYKAKFTINP